MERVIRRRACEPTSILIALALVACAPRGIQQPGQTTEAVAAVRASTTAEPTSLERGTLTLQASQETIYMWGGLYMDPALEAPVPLTTGVVAPGQALTFVRVDCQIRGPQAKASVRCSATGRGSSPASAAQWHERLHACVEVRERAPKRSEVRAVEAEWKTILAGSDFQTKGMAWIMARYTPTPPSTPATLVEVAVTHEYQGPERVARGCDNVPPDQGCDPVLVETGRTITIARDAVRYAYSGAPGIEIERLFGGRAPLLHRIRIGEPNEGGYVELDPSLRVDGGGLNHEEYRRLEFAALDAFDPPGELGPELEAALLIDKAVTTLHLRDLDLLREQVDALRALLAKSGTAIDRRALELDNALAVFERVLAREWLLDDPCV